MAVYRTDSLPTLYYLSSKNVEKGIFITQRSALARLESRLVPVWNPDCDVSSDYLATPLVATKKRSGYAILTGSGLVLDYQQIWTGHARQHGKGDE